MLHPELCLFHLFVYSFLCCTYCLWINHGTSGACAVSNQFRGNFRTSVAAVVFTVMQASSK